MKNILLPFFLAAACLLSSCEKEVTGIKLPQSGTKMVVTGFISPQDTMISVRVTRSQPTLGYHDPLGQPVPNATVTLSDGTQTRQLAFSSQARPIDLMAGYLIPTRDFPIVAGATYTLQVSVPGGETVEATCTVPEALAEAPSIVIDSVSQPNDTKQEYFVRLNWADVGGQENYYRPQGETTFEYTATPDNRPAVAINPVGWEGEEHLDDKGKDGERLYSPRGRLWMGFTHSSENPPLYFNAHVLHTDRHYYQYHRSLQLASRSQDNPFAEPVLVYSNVTGGLGVFAAYNRTTMVIRFR